ncbi:hypothetical protein [Desulfovibrio piger]|uniref:hypothetical protein n=1 Tax=Desulfovibrio piger TaxID=901 RepID=UPI0026E948F7|nr:hypothetical protein [Desulfovibrio piger]
MGIIAETSLFTNTPGPNAVEGLEALRQNQLAIRELSGALPPESLTVVDGAISPTRSTVIIDTEGGAPADDLVVINPVLSDSTTLHDGMVIELVGKDDSRIVTVKHGSGQNQISLVDQEDIALSTQYALRLQWDAQAALWRQRRFFQPLKPATALKLGGVKIGSGITIAPDGTISIDPWNIFPMRVPIAVDGVKFGGSDGRRAIMPGETEPRENWILCDGGSDGKGGTVPNLLGRMILGASDTYKAGSTGGSETHAHSLSGTVGATTLSKKQLASHAHGITVVAGYNGAGTGYRIWQGTEDGETELTGGSQPHSHDLTGASGEASGLPPYYALSYIMRTA